MRRWTAFSALLALPASISALEKTLGVAPELLSKYVPPESGKWKCLDDSKEIPWDFVNDDSCDCVDGSDEPGTSACLNNTFYCRNEGHIGAYIMSSRVNDGLCEPECCDGSDESPGVCPNACKAIGDEYRKNMEAERKLRKTGSKIRSSYITFAHKEKKRLEGVIESTTQEIVVREKEVARLQEVVDRSESLSAEALEHKKQSPLYNSLIDHHAALKSLQRELKKHTEREQALGDILDSLRNGYNPNYQDMAVLEAVRGWEALAGLPHIGVEADAAAAAESDTAKEGEEGKEGNWEDPGVEVVGQKGEEEVIPEGEWTKEDLDRDLDALLKADHVELLLEHDEHVRSPSEDSMLFDLSYYLPDSFIPQYEDFKDMLVTWLESLRIISPAATVDSHSTRARSALTEAENALEKVQNEKKTAEEDVKEIFNIHGFGQNGEWKKLDGMCLEKDTGDYTYEVCLFNEAKQKPNHGGQTYSLGKFESWNPSESTKAGEEEYYKVHMYTRGAKCWNGPERSVILKLACGLENTLLTVQELEKCEYEFTGTTPALCWPLEENGNGNGNGKKGEEKDEL